MHFHLALIIVAVGAVRCLKDGRRFPLTFKLCAYYLDGDNERFEAVGYENEEKMYLGQSRFNDSIFGWSGFGGGATDPSSLLALTNFDWSALVTKVEYDHTVVSGKDIAWPKVQKIHGCATFDPNEHFAMGEGGELFITVAKTYNLGMSVYIEDSMVTVSRTLKANSKAYTGAKLSLADLSQTWTKKFLLSVSQSDLSQTSDRPQSCVHYPTKEYPTYRHCDDSFLSDVCRSLNLTPFWATEDLSQVTSATSRPGKVTQLDLWNLFDGSRQSDCPLPCLATSVRGHELAEFTTRDRHSTLAFSFHWQ